MISKIRIERFKNIIDLTLELSNINLLVGANNAGKSSIRQAIQFAVAVAQTTGIGNTQWRNNRLSTSLSSTQLVYSPLRDVYALAPGGTLKEDVSKAIVITFESGSEHTTKVIVRKGRNKNILTELIGEYLGKKLQNMEEPFSIYVPGLAGIPAFEEYKSSGIVKRAAARGDANNVFRNVLWLLKQDTEKWQQFIDDFNHIFPEIEIDVDFVPDRDEHINATIVLNNQKLPIDAAGTGVLQAIQILSYINVYRPKVLILDEPDAHLHPNNQRILAQILTQLTTERDLQIILSTHSRHLLDELSSTAKLFWIRDGMKVNEDSYDEVKVLLDLGALDRGDKLQRGNIKAIILTEDTNTKPLEILLKSSGFRMDEVEIWSYHGCTKIDTALTLAAFIRKHAPSTNIVLHRDRDYLSDDEVSDLSERLTKKGISVFITAGTDTESHFICAKHINHLYPALSFEEIQTLIEEATAEIKDKSIEKFINSRTESILKEGKKPNNGKIFLECKRKYEQNPIRYRYGKSVIGVLKDKIQQKLGVNNVDFYQISPYIEDPTLKKFAQDYWGEQKPSEEVNKIVIM